MNYNTLTIKDLQRFGRAGDKKALIELGCRAVDMILPSAEDGPHHCEATDELYELQCALENDIPAECPHCGKFVGEV